MTDKEYNDNYYNYKKRSSYTKIRGEADAFAKQLLELQIQYKIVNLKPKTIGEMDDQPVKRERVHAQARELYARWNSSKLYNNYGGLYCLILQWADMKYEELNIY